MTEGLSQFRADMARVRTMAGEGAISSKAQRYLRAFSVGLPQDITVRWFPKEAQAALEARVADLTAQDREVWISQGLPHNPLVDEQLSSVERRTDLIKGLHSMTDFRERGLPTLQGWEDGSWAKVYYDTPKRALVGGTLRIDTNRHDSAPGVDMRAIRLEAAAGMSDVRDLDRQLSARQVVVIHPAQAVIAQITTLLHDLELDVIGLTNWETALDSLMQIATGSKDNTNPAAKHREPRVIMLDFSTDPAAAAHLLHALKGRRDTSSLPVLPLVTDEASFPDEFRAMVDTFVYLPVEADALLASVYMIGFRLLGDTAGFHFPHLGLKVQQRITGLLNTVLGSGNSNLRKMARVANMEQRPTVAFEFKLVPVDPYDFFFLDYEWSGAKSPLHRFDWLYNFGDGG